MLQRKTWALICLSVWLTDMELTSGERDWDSSLKPWTGTNSAVAFSVIPWSLYFSFFFKKFLSVRWKRCKESLKWTFDNGVNVVSYLR